MERRTRALVPWGGIDEFDRFAAALGATLPTITDETTGSGGADSEGNTEYLEAEQSDSEPDEGLRTPVARSPLTGSSGLIGIDMAGVMRITPFVGHNDGKENPVDYIADIKMAARSWDATYGADAENPESSKIALFRQNLDKDGVAWH